MQQIVLEQMDIKDPITLVWIFNQIMLGWMKRFH